MGLVGAQRASYGMIMKMNWGVERGKSPEILGGSVGSSRDTTPSEGSHEVSYRGQLVVRGLGRVLSIP